MTSTVIPARTVTVVVEDTTLDLVCFEVALAALGDPVRAGQLPGYLQATLENNPGLAVHIVLPLNTRIALPDFGVPAPAAQSVRLWD